MKITTINGYPTKKAIYALCEELDITINAIDQQSKVCSISWQREKNSRNYSVLADKLADQGFIITNFENYVKETMRCGHFNITSKEDFNKQTMRDNVNNKEAPIATAEPCELERLAKEILAKEDQEAADLLYDFVQSFPSDVNELPIPKKAAIIGLSKAALNSQRQGGDGIKHKSGRPVSPQTRRIMALLCIIEKLNPKLHYKILKMFSEQ